MKLNRNFAFAVTTIATLGALLAAGSAFAAGPNWSIGQGGGQGNPQSQMRMNMRPGVFGTVSAINGTTLTVESKGFGRQASTTTATPTTYTVDASNANVFKDNATSSVSAIAVNDTVMVQGTISGTNVTATTIRDGVVPMGQGMGGFGRGGNNGGMGGPHASSTQMMFPQGNGEPVVGGTVSVVSGSSITMTNNNGSNTYTVDASSATVRKGNATSSVSAIGIGDNILVQGTINGNAVTASSIIDQGAPKTNPGSSSSNPVAHAMGGIFGGLGNIFHNLFGFF